MSDLRLAAAELELERRTHAEPDDPYATLPDGDHPDAEHVRMEHRELLESAIGQPLGRDQDDLAEVER